MRIDWVIVTAPTDRGSDPSTELSGALDEVRRRLPGTTLRTAVLGGRRTVADALDEAASAGARTIMLISGQTVVDRATDAWFRRIVGHWVRARADAPEVRIGRSLADCDSYATLLAEAIEHGGEPARTTTAPLASAAWQEVPGFSRHLLLCRGPRCSAQGSGETQRALADVMSRRGLGDDDVLVTLTGCMFPCNQAPVAAVYPDDVWYASLTEERVERIVDEHLVGDRPVTEWSAPRRDGR